MERRQTRWNGWGNPGYDDPLAVNEPAWRWLTQAFAMPALLATPPRDFSDVMLAPSRLPARARQKLTTLLGSFGVQQGDFERARHAAGRGLTDLLRLRAGDLSAAPDVVLYPRNETDCLAALMLCAELDIAIVPFGGGTGTISVARDSHCAVAALDLSDLNRVTSVDLVSGTADAEAGILGPDLERQLAARGIMLGHRPEDFEFSSLGGWIVQPGAGQEAARYGAVGDWLLGVRVATPRGLVTSGGLPDLKHIMPGSNGSLGVVTGATLRVRALPAQEAYHAYLFPDFASGLAAMRAFQRTGEPHAMLRLCDDGQTRFFRALERAGREWNFRDHLFDIYLSVRRFESHAARLLIGFAGSAEEISTAHKGFHRLAKRLGALPLGLDATWPERRFGTGYRRDTFLDRGAGMDSLELFVSWAKLPSVYVTMRGALKQAMRQHAPRPSAHGLVFCHVGPARSDGAVLTFTWLYPRILDDGVAQADSIRRVALAVAASLRAESEELDREILRGIKQTLDPTAVLPAIA
ncbi:MAG TPA: FAD-binding oxidoreductase [Rhizomicrobium sp.]|nr:FAD-binding oxidoreductase [Rhizomicrobium sp.]